MRRRKELANYLCSVEFNGALATNKTPRPDDTVEDNKRTTETASCSDITGTNSTAPAATHCKDAARALHAARVTRKAYPAYADEQYQKAAAAYHAAGDTMQQQAVLAAAEGAPAEPAELPEQLAIMREAATYITAARAAETNDPTCWGLTRAAQDYLHAARLLLRTFNSVPSEELMRTDRLLLRHDALVDLGRSRQGGRAMQPEH